MQIQFHGAAEQVTGSCYLLTVNGTKVLLDCGMVQGNRLEELRNADAFAFDPSTIDAVILSHSHIDHSGRIPFLVKSGFTGKIFTQKASRDLCRIMLKDAGYLNEREAEWENKKRLRKGLDQVEPYFTVKDAQQAMTQFKGIEYGVTHKLSAGITFRFSDAGHILGSSIVEIWLTENSITKKIVFSGDIGYPNRPLLHDPAIIKNADLVLLESTYGDRFHRTAEQTQAELTNIFCSANSEKGNVIIPAFAVGRTQRLLYEFVKNFEQWELDRWQIYLDSPMAISATEVYRKYTKLYDDDAAEIWNTDKTEAILPNLKLSKTANQSMQLNTIRSGAIIIAGSGMCTGGRIKHHLKHNAWRKDCHIVMTGFQARGTPGRQLVDGSPHIRLWGETVKVNAKLHTVGGLSAHADQAGLINWYQHFDKTPPVILVHGEPPSLESLQQALIKQTNANVQIAKKSKTLNLLELDTLTFY